MTKNVQAQSITQSNEPAIFANAKKSWQDAKQGQKLTDNSQALAVYAFYDAIITGFEFMVDDNETLSAANAFDTFSNFPSKDGKPDMKVWNKRRDALAKCIFGQDKTTLDETQVALFQTLVKRGLERALIINFRSAQSHEYMAAKYENGSLWVLRQVFDKPKFGDSPNEQAYAKFWDSDLLGYVQVGKAFEKYVITGKDKYETSYKAIAQIKGQILGQHGFTMSALDKLYNQHMATKAKRGTKGRAGSMKSKDKAEREAAAKEAYKESLTILTTEEAVSIATKFLIATLDKDIKQLTSSKDSVFNAFDNVTVKDMLFLSKKIGDYTKAAGLLDDDNIIDGGELKPAKGKVLTDNRNAA